MNTRKVFRFGLIAIITVGFAVLAGCKQPLGTAGDTTAPALSNGSVSRTSHTAAAIGFTSSEAGTAYCLVQNAGDAAPAKEAVKAGTSLGAAAAGANSGKAVILTAGAIDIYVVVVDAAGNISAPLKIEAAAFSGGSGDPDCECNGVEDDCDCAAEGAECDCPVCEPAAADITYTVDQIGGENNVTNSTGIKFDFSAPVSGLTAGEITVNNGGGTVIKGNLSGSGTSWTLGITVAAAGNVTVSINKTGIEAEAKNVTVYKAGEAAPALTGITAVYTPTAIIYPATPLDDLKDGLTVTAQYSSGSDTTLSDSEYTLDGTLAVGESVITVAYEGETTTFTVTVTAQNVTFTGITAAYIQTAAVYPNTPLDSLKADLTVKAQYSDSSETTLNAADYTLSGTLAAPASTITVAYLGETDEFTVTVTAPATVSLYAIGGVTAPARGGTPVAAITGNAQYTGTVAWTPDEFKTDGSFKGGTVYTATITLEAAEGFTFNGLAADIFTVAGTSSPAASAANSGVITAVFPATAADYIITNSASGFRAASGGVNIANNQTMANTLTAIRTDAGGEDIAIQFGSGGTNELSAGAGDNVNFNNTGGTWGLITLTGKITSSNNTQIQGTVRIGDGVSVNSRADIANSNTGNASRAIYNAGGTVTISGGTVSTNGLGIAIYNYATGAVNISGGTVSAAGTYAVYNDSNGTVNISGGTVLVGSSYAVYNYATGAVNISGGTVSANTVAAIYNQSTGVITISGTPSITSANNSATSGTVHLSSTSGTTPVLILPSNWATLITNKSTGANANKIYPVPTGSEAWIQVGP